MKVFLIIIAAITAFVIYIKFFKKEPVEHEEEEPVEEPQKPVEPTKPDPPKPPKKQFIVDYSPNSTEDQSDYIMEQLNAIGNGSSTKRPVEVILGDKGGRIKVEKERGHRQSIIQLENKKHWRIYGNESNHPVFYRTKPNTPFNPPGSPFSLFYHSECRSFQFLDCIDTYMAYIDVEGPNQIPGKLIGTAHEYTPQWWGYAKDGVWIIPGIDDGAILNAPVYRVRWEQEHAVLIAGCKDFALEHCNINGSFGDGVSIGLGRTGESNNILLRKLILNNTGRGGVSAYDNVTGLTIDGIEVKNPRRSKTNCEPHTQGGYVRNVEIKNCKLHGGLTTFAANGIGDVSDVNIHHNEYSFGHPVICYDSSKRTRRKNWKFTNNINKGSFSSMPGIPALHFGMVDNILIENNIQPIQHKDCITFNDCGGEIKVMNNDWMNGTRINTYGNTEITRSQPELEIINND